MLIKKSITTTITTIATAATTTTSTITTPTHTPPPPTTTTRALGPCTGRVLDPDLLHHFLTRKKAGQARATQTSYFAHVDPLVCSLARRRFTASEAAFSLSQQ